MASKPKPAKSAPEADTALPEADTAPAGADATAEAAAPAGDHDDVPAFDAAPITPATLPPDAGRRSLLVRAPGPRWRCGEKFGTKPRLLSPDEIEAIATRRLMSPRDVVRELAADPHLSVLSVA